MTIVVALGDRLKVSEATIPLPIIVEFIAERVQAYAAGVALQLSFLPAAVAAGPATALIERMLPVG